MENALGARFPYLPAGHYFDQEEESQIKQSRLSSYTEADLFKRQTFVSSQNNFPASFRIQKKLHFGSILYGKSIKEGKSLNEADGVHTRVVSRAKCGKKRASYKDRMKS